MILLLFSIDRVPRYFLNLENLWFTKKTSLIQQTDGVFSKSVLALRGPNVESVAKQAGLSPSFLSF